MCIRDRFLPVFAQVLPGIERAHAVPQQKVRHTGVALLGAQGHGLQIEMCIRDRLCAVLFSFQIMAVNHYGPQVDGVRLSLRQFFVVAVESSVAALLLEHPAPAEFAVNAVPLLYLSLIHISSE